MGTEQFDDELERLDELSDDELRELHEEMVSELQDVDRQLTTRKPTERLSQREYQQYLKWRRGAITFRTHLLEEKRLVMAEIRQRQAQRERKSRTVGESVDELREEIRDLRADVAKLTAFVRKALLVDAEDYGRG